MTGKTFVLIPPSEAKAPGGSSVAKVGAFDGDLAAERREVVGALGGLLTSGGDEAIEKVLKVHGHLLDRALRSTSLLVAGTPPLLAAWRRYIGVVWVNLDPQTLSPAQRRAILIPSGLYGITGGTDSIGDYRLKMDTSLAPLGNMARYWRPHLTGVLAAKVRRGVVVNLLPKEHEAAIDWRALEAQCDVIKVTFVESSGRGAAGHAAKAVKGAIARTVLEGGLKNLESFRFEGWQIRRDGDQFVAVAPRLDR